MAVRTYSASVDTLFTTTLQLIRPRLADAIFKQNPLLFWMLAKGRVKLESGGRDINEPIIYNKNPTVMNYSGYDRLNVTPSEEATEALYNWKLKAGTVSISGEEAVVKNSGPAAFFNMLKTKVMVLEKTMREDLNEDLIRMNALKGAKEFLGLDTFIEAGTYGTVGGINGNTYSWWRNQWAGSKNVNALVSEMRKMYNNCTKGGETPDLILVPQHYFEVYESEFVTPGLVTAAARTNMPSSMLKVSDTRLGDMGFDNLRFKGATMMWDELLENTTLRSATNAIDILYFIHSPSLSLTIHRNRNFVMQPFQVPYDQDARVAKVLLAGNLTSNNRRHLGGIQFTTTGR